MIEITFWLEILKRCSLEVDYDIKVDHVTIVKDDEKIEILQLRLLRILRGMNIHITHNYHYKEASYLEYITYFSS